MAGRFKHEKRRTHADWITDRLEQPAFGLEAELTLIVDDQPMDPEAVFGDPRGFIREPLMHRIGTSYHLPNGAAVYFDTGVIEIATPAIEIERGCVTRAARSLWEGIRFIRGELDRWGREHDRRVRLQGFSTHYNVSVGDQLRGATLSTARAVRRLARTLVFVLPVPVMMLGTNRRSTGVGVRPRPARIEITADFTPDMSLMIAVGSFVAYSRVEAREHHPHDVIAGASIGILSSYIFTRHYKGWDIELEGGRKSCGITLSHAW